MGRRIEGENISRGIKALLSISVLFCFVLFLIIILSLKGVIHYFELNSNEGGILFKL